MGVQGAGKPWTTLTFAFGQHVGFRWKVRPAAGALARAAHGGSGARRIRFVTTRWGIPQGFSERLQGECPSESLTGDMLPHKQCSTLNLNSVCSKSEVSSVLQALRERACAEAVTCSRKPAMEISAIVWLSGVWVKIPLEYGIWREARSPRYSIWCRFHCEQWYIWSAASNQRLVQGLAISRACE